MAVTDPGVYGSDTDIGKLHLLQYIRQFDKGDALCSGEIRFSAPLLINDSVRLLPGEKDREARSKKLLNSICRRPGYILRPRHDKGLIGGAPDDKPSAGNFRDGIVILLIEDIRRQNLKINLLSGQSGRRLLDLIEVRAHPLGLSHVKNRGWNDSMAPAHKFADPVHIFHEFPEMPVLGIVAVGIEVGRTIRVRKFLRRKGMGDEVVDPADQEVVRQVFFKADSLTPAVGPEDFAHGVADLCGLDGRCGRGELGQGVLEKFPLP